jgi:hypothetical protein
VCSFAHRIKQGKVCLEMVPISETVDKGRYAMLASRSVIVKFVGFLYPSRGRQSSAYDIPGR